MREIATTSRRAALLAAVLTASPPLPLLATTNERRPGEQRSAMKVSWGPFKDMTTDKMDELNELSRQPDAGVTLPNGLRIIDLVVGNGPEPKRGDRVYCHYKIWADGFRVGKAVDISFVDNRPLDWILGEAAERQSLPSMVATEGAVGMREGGWRRIYVPNAYGEIGLRRINLTPTRYTAMKAPLVVQPGAPAYVDLIMLDGGSGRCERFLRPPGVSEKEARKLKSLTCEARAQVY